MNFRRTFKFGLILSLLIHALVAVSILLKPEPRPPLNEVISMSIVEAPAQKAPSKNVKKEVVGAIQKDSVEKQIVEQTHKPINDDIPTKDAYLSEHNQTVVRETKTANHGRFENKQTEASPKKPSTQQKVAQKAPENTKVTRKAMAITSEDGLPTLDALKPKFNWDNAKQNNQLARGEGKATDASKTDDYLKDVDNGIQTLLSTREFVYYSYYNRIKRQLAQYWEPKIKEKIRHIFAVGRKIASDQDRITRLLIILDSHGTLIGVKVLGESGVTDLDDAAIEAFREAAPFPNPPHGIVEKDGTIKIRWDFVLEA